MRAGMIAIAVCAAAIGVGAQRPVDVGERARAAAHVVVATVADVTSMFDVNEFGDQLIVSTAQLRVEETLKGSHVPTVVMKVEGGTVGDLTLHVSDIPPISRGERAVIFLDQISDGTYALSGRGRGLLKLDRENRVEGSTTTLDEIRPQVRSSSR